jgi:hypothetical protein
MSPAMSLWRAFSALTLGLTVFAAPSAALVVHVPGDQPTIQAGINVAQPGDMVLVAPATYSGAGNINLDFLGKNIAVVSEGGPAVTTIDIQFAGRGFHLQSNLPATARVEGFSIINGSTSGILITEASPTIRNCIFTGNAPEGILAVDLNSAGPVQIATIEDCIFSANRGNGLKLRGHRVQVNRCTFEDNTVRGLHHEDGGMTAGSGTYVDCIIRRNTEGGILFAQGFTGGNFTNCEITDHTISLGGAGVRDISAEGVPVFQNCLFARNHSTNGNGGGALIAGDGGSQFAGCQFEENSALNGGGVYYGLSPNSLPVTPVSGCRFVNNAATETGGGLYVAPAHSLPGSTISANLFWNNSAGQKGGAVVMGSFGPGVTLLLSNTLVGNSAPEAAGVYAQRSLSPTMRIERTIIAFSTSGQAVTCEDPTRPVNVLCGDIFGNPGGDWAACIAGEFGVDGNIAADPQFCDATNGDFRLSAASPCAPPQSGACDVIGAYGVGCGTTAVEPATWGSIKATLHR